MIYWNILNPMFYTLCLSQLVGNCSPHCSAGQGRAVPPCGLWRHRRRLPGRGSPWKHLCVWHWQKQVRLWTRLPRLVSEAWPPPESHDRSVGRFHLVQKTGQACTALAFNLHRTTELLVALADHTIKCFDKGRIDTSHSAHPFVLVATVLPSRRFSWWALIVDGACYSASIFLADTKQMISWMRGHEGAVSFISVHSSGRYAISTSVDTAQLWDLDTFQRKRKLTVRQPVDIQRVNMALKHINEVIFWAL